MAGQVAGPRRAQLPMDEVVPASLQGVLRDHQVDGVKFMFKHATAKTGCILAHSMGLGKTAQVVVLCAALFRSSRRTVLVLTPKSTIMNWEVEFNTWCDRGQLRQGNPCMRCYRVDDNDLRSRVAAIDRWQSTGGVLFMGYEQYCNLLGAKVKEKAAGLGKALSSPGPDVLICDEGHRIKSAASHTTAVLMKVKTKARVILTGTPIQNNLLEYYAMIQFVKTGFFPRLYFHDYFVTPINKGQKWDAEDHEIQLMKDRAYILTQEVKDFILRRDQSILKAALPPKREYVVFCPMSEFQQTVYTAFKDAYFAQNNKRMNLLSYIMTLNKIGAHPDLLYNSLKKRDKSDKLSAIESAGWADDVLACFSEEHGYRKAALAISPKLMLCLSLYIAHATKRQKMLVFSQYIDTLDYIERMMKNAISGLVLYRLDGGLNSATREAAIKGFQAHKGACVFLISTKAGGVGVNLNTAHCAVLYDVAFNPAIDQQAVFRCYRYGQVNPVTIYRLVSDETPEARIYDRCVSKEWMSRKVIDDTAPTRDFVTTVDLRTLFAEERGDVTREDPPHVVQRWMEERASCLAQAPELQMAVNMLKAKGLSVSKIHRHESLLEDKASESVGLTEQQAYQEYKAHNREQGGSDSDSDRPPAPAEASAARRANALDDDGFDLEELARVVSMSEAHASSRSATPPPLQPGAPAPVRGRGGDDGFDADELALALQLSKEEAAAPPFDLCEDLFSEETPPRAPGTPKSDVPGTTASVPVTQPAEGAPSSAPPSQQVFDDVFEGLSFSDEDGPPPEVGCARVEHDALSMEGVAAAAEPAPSAAGPTDPADAQQMPAPEPVPGPTAEASAPEAAPCEATASATAAADADDPVEALKWPDAGRGASAGVAEAPAASDPVAALKLMLAPDAAGGEDDRSDTAASRRQRRAERRARKEERAERKQMASEMRREAKEQEKEARKEEKRRAKKEERRRRRRRRAEFEEESAEEEEEKERGGGYETPDEERRELDEVMKLSALDAPGGNPPPAKRPRRAAEYPSAARRRRKASSSSEGGYGTPDEERRQIEAAMKLSTMPSGAGFPIQHDEAAIAEEEQRQLDEALKLSALDAPPAPRPLAPAPPAPSLLYDLDAALAASAAADGVAGGSRYQRRPAAVPGFPWSEDMNAPRPPVCGDDDDDDDDDLFDFEK
eukprot:TRINITY_DN5023_c2_g1_i1.p1 TRINITY_DN5023_c2_g1~~TRINITY_DN5023_c2_g1_i1.p1  ORF type:complete len:1199 (+),score=384.13 TRINITY_DN5023_c2_g1_i1:54-3599(+)